MLKKGPLSGVLQDSGARLGAMPKVTPSHQRSLPLPERALRHGADRASCPPPAVPGKDAYTLDAECLRQLKKLLKKVLKEALV